MSAWRGWLVRLRRGLRRRDFEAEMAEEMRAHLELEAEARRGRGREAVEARREAALAFGHVESLKETVRDRRFGRWASQMAQDVRYAIRLLGKWPAFSAVVLATIALGVGGTATIFSALDAALLRPLPYPQPDRLVRIYETHRHRRRAIPWPAARSWTGAPTPGGSTASCSSIGPARTCVEAAAPPSA